jgi:hypothetical protein
LPPGGSHLDVAYPRSDGKGEDGWVDQVEVTGLCYLSLTVPFSAFQDFYEEITRRISGIFAPGMIY